MHLAKSDESNRPLGKLILRNRVFQQFASIVLEPMFEADFAPSSYRFRPKRSGTDDLEACRMDFIEGNYFIFEADIKNFPGEIDHENLLSMVAERANLQATAIVTELSLSLNLSKTCVVDQRQGWVG